MLQSLSEPDGETIQMSVIYTTLLYPVVEDKDRVLKKQIKTKTKLKTSYGIGIFV